MECPICKTRIDDIRQIHFCPVCQWELLELPNTSSQKLKDYFEELVSNFKTYYSQLQKDREISASTEELIQANKALEESIAEKSEALEQMRKDQKTRQEKLDYLRELDKKILVMDSELKEIETDIKKAQKLLDSSKDYDKILKKLLDDYLVAYNNGYGKELKEIGRWLRKKNLLNS
jgi:DNA repair exonuclease SbcCD ATPase subunit